MSEQQTIQQIYVHNWAIFPHGGKLLALIQPNYAPVPQPGFVFAVKQREEDGSESVAAFVLDGFLCSISNGLAQLWEVTDVTSQLVGAPQQIEAEEPTAETEAPEASL